MRWLPCTSGSRSRLAVCLLLVGLLAGCDPAFHRVRRFEPAPPVALLEHDLERLEQLAAARGFASVEAVPEEVERLRAEGREVLAVYSRTLRENWGSSSLSVLLVSDSGAIELEAWAFPSAGEPEFLGELEAEVRACLLEKGYRVAES